MQPSPMRETCGPARPRVTVCIGLIYHPDPIGWLAMASERAHERGGGEYNRAMPEAVDSFSAVRDEFVRFVDGRVFRTILADPPWQFQNRTGKVAPEHRRLNRYATLTSRQI